MQAYYIYFVQTCFFNPLWHIKYYIFQTTQVTKSMIFFFKGTYKILCSALLAYII